MTALLPLIGIVGDQRVVDGLAVHCVGDKYAAAVSAHSNTCPVAILGQETPGILDSLVSSLDGFVFSGSVSNVHPSLYAGTSERGPFDQRRDRLALDLIGRILERRKPALFICRGLQELNVACGGTLHADVASLPGRLAHHSPSDLDEAGRYAPLHEIRLSAGASTAGIFGIDRFRVNSLHYQAVDRVGDGLRVEGAAADGTPELIVVKNHPFAVGVQWHPEYRPDLHDPSRRLLEAFGRALRDELDLL